MPTVDVTCPEGVSEGELLHVEYEGVSFDVHVPPGVQSGTTFAVELETAATQPESEPESRSQAPPTAHHHHHAEPAEPEAEALESELESAVAELVIGCFTPPTVSQPAGVPGAAAGLSILMAAVAQRRLSPANAQALATTYQSRSCWHD